MAEIADLLDLSLEFADDPVPSASPRGRAASDRRFSAASDLRFSAAVDMLNRVPGSDLPSDQTVSLDLVPFPGSPRFTLVDLSAELPAAEIHPAASEGARITVSDWEADEFWLSARSDDPDASRCVDAVQFDSDSDSDDTISAPGADSGTACIDEEFEWEEVEDADDDGHLDVRESVLVAADEDDAARSVEWEVLESYFTDDHEGFVYTSEFDVVVGQFAGSYKGTPPAAKSVVESLPSVVLTREEIDGDDASCAVCKDEIAVEERAKKLPCSHLFHEECILPWLGIRNTCPLCRFELPTDDADYEKWKVRRAGNEAPEEEAQLRYEFEILSEA